MLGVQLGCTSWDGVPLPADSSEARGEGPGDKWGGGNYACHLPGHALPKPQPSLLLLSLGTASAQSSQAGFWLGKGSVIH